MADFFDLSNTQQNNNDDFFKLDKKETNQPQPEQFSKLMPGNYNTEDEIVENTLKGLASGTMRNVIGGIGAAPSTAARSLYKLAAYPQNKLAEFTGNEDLKVDYDEDFLGKFKALKPIDDVFIRGGEAAANIADNLSPLQNFDKDMLTNFKEGNYRDFGSQLFYNAVETAPQIAMMAYTSGLSGTMSGAAETSNLIGNSITKANLVREMPSIMMGTSAAGSSYIENRQNSDMTEGERLLNAASYGIAEAAWERVWTLPMIRKIAADELIEKPVKEGFLGAAQDYGLKILKGASGEAVEEGGTELTNILTDLSTNKDVGNPFNRVFTATVSALLPGGVMGGAGNINQRNYNLQVQKGAKMAWDTIFNNPQEVEVKKFNLDDNYRPVTKPAQLTTTEIAGLLETKGESPIILESGEALGPPVIELWPESQTYLDTGTGEVFVSGGEEITLPKVNRFVDPSGQYVGNSEIDITTVARQRKQQEDVAQTPIEQPNNVDNTNFNVDNFINKQLNNGAGYYSEVHYTNTDNYNSIINSQFEILPEDDKRKLYGDNIISNALYTAPLDADEWTRGSRARLPNYDKRIIVKIPKQNIIEINNPNEYAEIWKKYVDNDKYNNAINSLNEAISKIGQRNEVTEEMIQKFIENEWIKPNEAEKSKYYDWDNALEQINFLPKEAVERMKQDGIKGIKFNIPILGGRQTAIFDPSIIEIEQSVEQDNTIEQESQTDEGLNTQSDTTVEETGQYIQQSNEQIDNFREMASQENTPGIPEELQSYVIHNGAKFDVIDTNGNTWTYQRIDDAINEARKTRAAIEGQPIQEGQQQQEGVVEDEGQQEDAQITNGIKLTPEDEKQIKKAGQKAYDYVKKTSKPEGKVVTPKMITKSAEKARREAEIEERQKIIRKKRETAISNAIKTEDKQRRKTENENRKTGSAALTEWGQEIADREIITAIYDLVKGDLDRITIDIEEGNISKDKVNQILDKAREVEMLNEPTYNFYKERFNNVEVAEEQLQINIQAEGRESETATPNNTEVKTKFAVMNADDIQASHDTSLNVNENFPQELQPRDRGKAATQEQIINIVNNLNPKKLGDSYSTATGSPILGPDGYVEVGNGRTIALKTLYEQNHKNAETYRQWLRDNAEQFGLTAKQIDNVDNPVLVRVRTSDVEDRVRFVQDANARESASMSASEQAMVDADRITQDLLNKFVPHDDGLINISANKPFINQFMDQVVGKAEKGEFLDEKGYLNQAGIRKVKNALFAAAYDDINILAEISESTSSNLKNVTGAMMEAAPRMVNIQDQMNKGILPDLDISQDLVEAVKLYKTIKNSDKSFDNYFQQQNMFGEDNYTPIQESLVRMFENNKRSRKTLREILIDYTYRVEHAGRADMDSMFDIEQPTKENLLRQSVEATVGKTNTSQETLFGKEPKNININGKNVKMSNNATEFSDKNKYARSEFTINDKTIEMPELLDIILALSEGKYPGIIKKLSNTGTLGYYMPKDGSIGLNPDIFIGPTIHQEKIPNKQYDRRIQEIRTRIENDPEIGEVEFKTKFTKNYVEVRVLEVDPEFAAQTMSHELGHLIDFIPRSELDEGELMDNMSLIYKGEKDETLDAIRDSKKLGPRLKKELQRLSQKWKPFDTSNKKYRQYRFSPEELYADAMSVFFLDPEMLQQEAPLFSQFIQKSISEKPQVQSAYEQVRHLMENRTRLMEKTMDNLQAGMQEGIEQHKIKLKRQKRSVKSGFDRFNEWFIDQNYSLYKYLKDSYRDTGEKGEAARNARNKMEEIAYMSSEIEDYLYNVTQLVEDIKNSEVTFDDFASYLFLQRVQNDRSKFANPGAINTVRAEDLKQELQNKYDQQQYAKIVSNAERFYQLRQERIIPVMEQSGMFTEAAMEKVRNNKEYVTFDVVDYINSEYGEGSGDIIMRQYGTLRDITNPLIATMLKDMQIINTIRINDSKIAAVKALKKIAPESVRQAPTKEIYGKIVPKDSTNADEGLIAFTIAGELDGYLVDKDIADLYEFRPHEGNTITNTILSVVQAMKSVMVSHNPGWMIFNIPRDFFATIMNNPELGVRDIPALAREYKKAFSESWADVFRNQRPEDVSEMRRNRMLTIDRMYRPSDKFRDDDTSQLLNEIFGAAGEDISDLDQQLAKAFNINPEAIRDHSLLREVMPDKALSLWDGLDNLGQVAEMAGQIAGYRMLSKRTNLSEGDLAHRVRTRVGTPDFKQRGEGHWLMNNLFIFSTIRKSGWTAAAESFRDNPGTFMFKIIMLSLLPKLLQLGAEEADELFPESEFAQKMSRIMEGVSEYKKETYLTLPLMMAGNKSVTVQLPQDFIGQAMTGIVYNAAKGEWGDVFGTAYTELPWNTSNVNPILQAVTDTARLMSGENIYDDWRGRNVISEEAMLTGNVGQKLKEFGLYQFFNVGGSAIVNPSIAYADGTLEALSNIVPFNAAKRLINVSESGYYEDVTQVYQDQKKYTQMVSNFNNSRRYGEKLRYDMKEIGEAKRKLSQLNKLIRHFANINKQIKYAQSQGNTELVDKLNMRKINLARQYTGKKPLDN